MYVDLFENLDLKLHVNHFDIHNDDQFQHHIKHNHESNSTDTHSNKRRLSTASTLFKFLSKNWNTAALKRQLSDKFGFNSGGSKIHLQIQV